MARTYPVRPVNPLCFLLTTSARKRVGCPLVSMASTARRTVLRAPPSRFTRGRMAAATRRASSPSNQALRSPRSIASQRSSSGVRFHRRHLLHTTHSRPFAGSNASRRPTGNSSTTSFEGSGRLQNMHVVYMGIGRAQLTRSEGVQRGPV